MKQISRVINFVDEKKDKIQLNELVFQHNHLVESRYTLTLQEKRLIIFLMSQIHREDTDFKNIEISIQELSKIIGVDFNGMYKEIKRITKKIMHRVIEIKDLDRNMVIQIPWIASAEYMLNSGVVRFQLSEKLVPYLILLKNNFTVCRLSDMMTFKSFYAIRLYELIKQYEKIGHRSISIVDLKIFLGIAESKYNLFSNFKIKVLDVAQREINNKSDIFISFDFIKTGRSISDIKFIISENSNYFKEKNITDDKKNKIMYEMKSRDRLLNEIQNSFGFTKKTVLKMTEYLADKEIEMALQSVKLQIERGHVKNEKSMIRSALREKWAPDVYVKR